MTDRRRWNPPPFKGGSSLATRFHPVRVRRRQPGGGHFGGRPPLSRGGGSPDLKGRPEVRCRERHGRASWAGAELSADRTLVTDPRLAAVVQPRVAAW